MEETRPVKSVGQYGSWPSPVSAASTVEGVRELGWLSYDRGVLYWIESRPDEGGRNTIMRRAPGGEPEEILPAPWYVRSRVHEYGGRSYLVENGTVWFSNFDDQRLYCMAPGEEPRPITPKADLRYAAFVLDRTRERLLCVREDQRPEGEPRNTLVALPLEGMSEGEILFEDADFVSAPSLSDDGSRVAFISWRHPNMPWDDTSLWSAGFDEQGALSGLTLHNEGWRESVIDPRWGEGNQLHASSDRDNWWSIYRIEGSCFDRIEAGIEQAEIGGPAWSIGDHYYHFMADGRIAARVMKGSVEYAAIIDPDRSLTGQLPLNSASVIDVLPTEDGLFVINAPYDQPSALLQLSDDGVVRQVIRTASDNRLEGDWIPAYRLISFPTGNGEVAHGIYLPPTNPGAVAPADTAPPLMVTVHGGPTGVSRPAYNISHLYWTSRGFAVFDLNYRGSTGFGREYRRSLYGRWGVADVEDAVAGATWLADQGLADPQRLVIRGGSAGGYTTLAAHAFHDAFAAGASYFGISDMEALARDTHKFESRYLDQVIGPYPECKELYVQRSPIHSLAGFTAPLLLLQGLDDPMVPPDQSRLIFEALKSRGVPTAYLPFAGEGHGFRKAANRVRALQAELYFYAQVLGFETSEELPGLEIVGLDESRTGESRTGKSPDG